MIIKPQVVTFQHNLAVDQLQRTCIWYYIVQHSLFKVSLLQSYTLCYMYMPNEASFLTGLIQSSKE